MADEALAALLFLGFEHGGTRSTIGAYLSDHWPALLASAPQTLCRRIQRSRDISCIWCSCPCLRQQETTAATTTISMSSKEDGMDVALNRFLPQPGPPFIHLDFARFKTGVRSVTLPLHIICGRLPPLASCAVAPMHWTRLISQGLSRRSRPRPRTAPCKLGLGKHLRASKLRPQARPKPRHKRLRKQTLTWKKQVTARLCAALDCWLIWSAPCAHWLAGLYCVLLLPRVVLFTRFVTTRSATAQAQTGPHDLHGTQDLYGGRIVLKPAKHRTSPALLSHPHPFRVRPHSAGSSLRLHTLALSIGLITLFCRSPPLPFLCSATMDPLRDPLHDTVLEEALADSGPATASTTAEAAEGETRGGAAADAGEDAASDEGSALSTLTAALAEADRSPSPDRRGPGPYGSPPAAPVSHPLARQYIPGSIPARPPALPTGFLGSVRRQRQVASTPAGSSSSARGPPAAPHM